VSVPRTIPSVAGVGIAERTPAILGENVVGVPWQDSNHG